MINIEQLHNYSQATLFMIWEGEVGEVTIDATRGIFRKLCETLLKLGAAAPIESIQAAFVTCVRSLNELDIQDPFICTIEREDLCEELWALGKICGVDDSVDDWIAERDW